VLIAPLLTGSGVRVKTVEAMAAGLPVVATTKGYEGLDAVPGRDLLVSDDPEGFARHLAHLADSLALRERLNRAAVGYVESHHDPERVAQIKAEAFRALLSR
jgi:glycosyltransferase involved in cell wall biosynthesis